MTMTSKMVECSPFFYLIHEKKEKCECVFFFKKKKKKKRPLKVGGGLLNYLSALNKPEEPSE